MFNQSDVFNGWSDDQVREMTELEIYTNVMSGDVGLEQFYKWVAHQKREAAR